MEDVVAKYAQENDNKYRIRKQRISRNQITRPYKLGTKRPSSMIRTDFKLTPNQIKSIKDSIDNNYEIKIDDT